MFKKDFGRFVCDGDSIECTVDGLDAVATLHYDEDTTPPDQRCEGFWPNLDPKSAGYIGFKSKRTLARHKAHAQHVLDSWKRDEWHYYGVAVTVFKDGIQLTDTYAHACWGIEGNHPMMRGKGNPNKYFRHVANNELGEALEAARAKLESLFDDPPQISKRDAVEKMLDDSEEAEPAAMFVVMEGRTLAAAVAIGPFADYATAESYADEQRKAHAAPFAVFEVVTPQGRAEAREIFESAS